jgi:hypothetical protein
MKQANRSMAQQSMAALLTTFVWLASAIASQAQKDVLSLAGQWQFLRGGPMPGVSQEALPNLEFDDTIRLPGTTETNEKGPQNNARSTVALTRLYRFDGPAWYQREVVIPETWRDSRVTLHLERSKYTQIWLDGEPFGESPIICSPQEYVLGALEPGTHRLTILVDNTRKPVQSEMHQMSDNTQGNWNGIIGKLELRATDAVWLENVQVYPNAISRSVRVFLEVGNATELSGTAILHWSVKSSTNDTVVEKSDFVFRYGERGVVTDFDIALGSGSALWDEFSPNLYELTLQFASPSENTGKSSPKKIMFGLRDFKHKGSQFTINDRITFLRGKHDGCVFPLTGHPPMEVDGWLKYLRVCKEYGINHIRFHTWTPPDAAFTAADQLGVYLQPELPFWGAYSEKEANALMPEAERILRFYGNHPSFVMFSMGNECGGDRNIMAEMVRQLRSGDSRHLYAQGSNNYLSSPTLADEDDYWTTVRVRNLPNGPIKGPLFNVRGSYADVDKADGLVQIGPPSTLNDYSASLPGIPVPVIGHEVGQYTVYPNFSEIAKYTGVMRPRNLEQFRNKLGGAGMIDQADAFFRASGKLAALCYREEIEAALRTPGFGGFQLLDLQDFPGQGTALVGILDAFMDSKGLIAVDEWRQFCAPVVLLARFEKYTWSSDETFQARIQAAHYGPNDLSRETLLWNLQDVQNRVLAKGRVKARNIEQGGLRTLGDISAALKPVSKPSRITLNLSLEKSKIASSYPLWVYPNVMVTNAAVTVVRAFDDQARQALASGGRVLLVTDSKSRLVNTVGGGFTTDFWCWPMFHNSPGTMGLLCDPRQPALAGFPTDFHSQWQWFNILTNSQPVILDSLPKDYRPLVQIIDNLDRVHRLGLIFEAKVGAGRLLVCAADLPAISDKPEARQLMTSLFLYAGSDKFNPTREFSPDTVRDLLVVAKPAKGKASASTAQSAQNDPQKAIDGNEQTRWCASSASPEQWWRIDLEKPTDMKGAEIIWEMDRAGYRYLLEGSADGSTWTPLSDQKQNQNQGRHQLDFQAKGIRSLRITITGLPQNAWASIREVRLF